MTVEDYEYDASKIFDFQYDDCWFGPPLFAEPIQPPRLKSQPVFNRLRVHTVASAGKMSKQTAIQKKQPAQLEKKNLKKKLVLLVLRERQQNKVTTNKTATPKKPSLSTVQVVPHYMQTTASSP